MGTSLSGTDVDSVVELMSRATALDPGSYDAVALRECIEAIQDSARACIACADAFLAEQMADELTDGVRTLLITADVCDVTARVLVRRTGPDDSATRLLLAACWAACRTARTVCEEFLPIHDHCRTCARVCRAAELACRRLLASAGSSA